MEGYSLSESNLLQTLKELPFKIISETLPIPFVAFSIFLSSGCTPDIGYPSIDMADGGF